MKVHVVMQHVKYEGDSLQSIHATPMGALKEVSRLSKENRHADVWYTSTVHELQD